MKLKVSDLKPASYNPRYMDETTKKALKTSMKEFNDISGITWNKTTGNIVTGHHRWENLLDIYGEKNLDFKPLTKTRYAIIDKKSKEDTGFVLRVVEWDEIREKAANVTANNHKLGGTFTDSLNDILEEVKIEFDEVLFEELRFDIPTTEINVGVDSEKVKVKEHERNLGVGEDDTPVYTRKVESPVYEPMGEKPLISDLFDDNKTSDLLLEISKAKLPEDVKAFLALAAYRHTVFNYKNIAEYYAHADKKTQTLMEKSALVIIDFNKAIEYGFVKLTEDLREAYLNEQQ